MQSCTLCTSTFNDLACYQYLGKFNSVPGHHNILKGKPFKSAVYAATTDTSGRNIPVLPYTYRTRLRTPRVR
jgi:hypothetical protein